MNCHYVQIQFRLYLVDSAQLNLITVPSTYLDYGNGNPLLNTRVKSFEVQTFEKFLFFLYILVFRRKKEQINEQDSLGRGPSNSAPLINGPVHLMELFR